MTRLIRLIQFATFFANVERDFPGSSGATLQGALSEILDSTTEVPRNGGRK